MLKIYKRTIHIGQAGADHRLDSSVRTENDVFGGLRPSKWQTIAGAVVGTLMFSVFFAAMLIPLGLLGIGAWLWLRKLKNSPVDRSIEAEYKVITDTEKKDP